MLCVVVILAILVMVILLKNRGAPYRGRGGRNAGGYGASGGCSSADDLTTTSFCEAEPQLFSIPELEQLPSVPPKTSTNVRTNEYEIDVSKVKKADQYYIKWTGGSKKRKKFYTKKQAKDEYDSGSMFFCQTKLFKDEEIRTFDLDLEVEKLDQVAKDYYLSLVKGTAEIRLDSLNGNLRNDRPVIHFLDLIFSQAQRQGGNRFFMIKSNEKIERTPVVLKEGVTRSIRIIGEPSDMMAYGSNGSN
uniref:Uncharacterized protein n=1 Tax=Panagrolaimus sp. PS1159 TaxID=55785 RepID=A0AC35EYQ5_9BILA